MVQCHLKQVDVFTNESYIISHVASHDRSGDGLPMDQPSTEKQPVKRQLSFSPKWVDDLHGIFKGSPKKLWSIQTSTGKSFRVARGAEDLPEIPDAQDFPLTVEPVSEEVLLVEELQRLHLEEMILEEELKLLELQAAQEKESQERASFLNSTIPASSKLAPSVCFLVALSVAWSTYQMLTIA